MKRMSLRRHLRKKRCHLDVMFKSLGLDLQNIEKRGPLTITNTNTEAIELTLIWKFFCALTGKICQECFLELPLQQERVLVWAARTTQKCHMKHTKVFEFMEGLLKIRVLPKTAERTKSQPGECAGQFHELF